jgi:hypothetical protein
VSPSREAWQWREVTAKRLRGVKATPLRVVRVRQQGAAKAKA